MQGDGEGALPLQLPLRQLVAEFDRCQRIVVRGRCYSVQSCFASVALGQGFEHFYSVANAQIFQPKAGKTCKRTSRRLIPHARNQDEACACEATGQEAQNSLAGRIKFISVVNNYNRPVCRPLPEGREKHR